MNHQKNKDHAAQDKHIFGGCPPTQQLIAVGIFLWAGVHIFQRDPTRPDDVNHKTNGQKWLHDPDNRVGSHEMCGQVKKVSRIIESQKQIQSEMDTEKWDQEKTADAHYKFSPDRGAHETAHKSCIN